MRRNKPFLRTDIEHVITDIKIPVESGRDIPYVADDKPLRKLGVNGNRTKVDLILNVFQIDAMATASYSAELSYFLVLHDFVTQRHRELVLAFCGSITDFYLFSFS